ncbi:hypothetical protein B9Z65_9015 [Elsinoe australis]|uniref:Uncharacterized protein n=1 Tax=Elsinoe australis TaxID=40998 RepID=A0A2P8ABJ8_9PEZI|nr:hypothetical protein B9Z65_9015 [Elsinoe australis]
MSGKYEVLFVSYENQMLWQPVAEVGMEAVFGEVSSMKVTSKPVESLRNLSPGHTSFPRHCTLIWVVSPPKAYEKQSECIDWWLTHEHSGPGRVIIGREPEFLGVIDGLRCQQRVQNVARDLDDIVKTFWYVNQAGRAP